MCGGAYTYDHYRPGNPTGCVQFPHQHDDDDDDDFPVRPRPFVFDEDLLDHEPEREEFFRRAALPDPQTFWEDFSLWFRYLVIITFFSLFVYFSFLLIASALCLRLCDRLI